MAVIYAAPTTRVIDRDGGKNAWAFDLQSAINRAEPGDVVQLLPGRYHKAVSVPVEGHDGEPITIRGQEDGSAILDGGREREQGRGSAEPMDDDFAFLSLVRTEHIVLEHISIENCWPTGIYLRSVKDIVIRDCHCIGSRYFIYARQLRLWPTQRLLLERLSWVQDPDHDMWDGRVTWRDVKAKAGHFDASFLNGAMFGSYDIEGQVVIRDCKIAHAFNAIRMDIRKSHVRNGNDGPEITRNKDVSIYGNSFAFIRDNAIEPEKGAQDWRVFNNHFFNVHAAFSLDGVALRDCYYVGNWLLNNRRPGLADQSNRSGKIFKFLAPPEYTDNMEPAPRSGLWSIFNSVQTRTSYAKQGRTSQWNDAYNAVGLYAADHPEEPGPPRALFFELTWNPRIQLRGLATNDAQFPDKYVAEGADVGGYPLIDTVFEIADFEIAPSLPLGGWDGRLNKSAALEALASEELVIERKDGGPLKIRAGLAPGAHDIADLGLSEWMEHW